MQTEHATGPGLDGGTTTTSYHIDLALSTTNNDVENTLPPPTLTVSSPDGALVPTQIETVLEAKLDDAAVAGSSCSGPAPSVMKSEINHTRHSPPTSIVSVDGTLRAQQAEIETVPKLDGSLSVGTITGSSNRVSVSMVRNSDTNTTDSPPSLTKPSSAGGINTKQMENVSGVDLEDGTTNVSTRTNHTAPSIMEKKNESMDSPLTASHRPGSKVAKSEDLSGQGIRATWRRDANARVVGLKDYVLTPSIYAKRQQPHRIRDGDRDDDSIHIRNAAAIASGSHPAEIVEAEDSHPKSRKKKKNSRNQVDGANKLTVEEKEDLVRQSVTTNPCKLTYLGNWAALKVMLFYLIGLTCYWYYRFAEDNNNVEARTTWNGGGMSFVLLAFALTAPMSAALTIAFNRRERALITIAEFRSWSYHLYMAHSLWDWPGSDGVGSSGREESLADWVEHCDAVMAQLVGIGDELARFLSLPTTSRSRHRMTQSGRREASKTIEVAYRLLESMATQRTTRLVLYSERIKKLGLPSGEASRMRQFERYLSSTMEQLRMVKMYRTPQAFRSFACIFTLVLPPFYAPTYAQVGQEVHSLGVGIAFGVITALALTALAESLQILEDPFTAFLALDGIDVCEEFEVLHFAQLCQARKLAFPNANPYPPGRRAALMASTESDNKKRMATQVGFVPKQGHHLESRDHHQAPILSPCIGMLPSETDMTHQSNTARDMNEIFGGTTNACAVQRKDLDTDLELGTPLDDDDTVRETIFAAAADEFEGSIGTSSDMINPGRRPRFSSSITLNRTPSSMIRARPSILRARGRRDSSVW